MKNDKSQLIEAIQASGYQSVWAVTGGGAGAVYAMLAHPGASRFVQDVRIPYGPEALEAFLGEKPASACSEETASLMAQAALDQASRISPHALGIACTAALQTSRERQGADRAHICMKSRGRQIHRRLELAPGSRAEQEMQLSNALLRAIGDFLEVDV